MPQETLTEDQTAIVAEFNLTSTEPIANGFTYEIGGIHYEMYIVENAMRTATRRQLEAIIDLRIPVEEHHSVACGRPTTTASLLADIAREHSDWDTFRAILNDDWMARQIHSMSATRSAILKGILTGTTPCDPTEINEGIIQNITAITEGVVKNLFPQLPEDEIQEIMIRKKAWEEAAA